MGASKRQQIRPLIESDVTPTFHPAATRDRPVLSRMSAGEAVDGGLEIDNGVEDAAFEPSFGELGKDALDRVEP